MENVVITPKREVRAWMVRTGRTFRSLAHELDISHSYLANVLAGRKRCSLPLAIRFTELSGLPIRLFDQLNPVPRRQAKRRATAQT
jgi:hypothetical protein